ncbi:hypothetical protein AHAS_Ahas07G0125400 [Arachis hypogaea]
MAHSSSSPSNKTQTVKFQDTFESDSEETFQLLAKIKRNQEQKIQISIKNQQKKEEILFKVTYYFTVLQGFSHFCF